LRRALLIVCDGLGSDWLGRGYTPAIDGLLASGRRSADHRAVFPSVTRVSAASIATGCYPGSHGLQGNQVALLEGDRLVVHDVGQPGFIGHLRQVKGRALCRPTLADRLADAGKRQVAYSNVSAGAAYFLDPEHRGWVHHRAGSYGPGGRRLQLPEHLDVTHDLAGDGAMARRFGEEVVAGSDAALGVLWLANPDLTLHHAPLGSPAHLEALQATDRRVSDVIAAVVRARDRDDILVALCSDHGHETIGAAIHIGDWMADRGLGRWLALGQIAIASQGTAALIHATAEARSSLAGCLQAMASEPWAGRIVSGEQMGALGVSGDDALFAVVDTRRDPEAVNAHGVTGSRWLVADGEKPPEIGCCHHGGLGPDETRPFLALLHPDLGAGELAGSTGLVDIAPTLLDFLDLPAEAMDGRSLIA